MKLGPTAANGTPARFVFVTTEAGKARLAPHLAEGNRAKSMVAPAVAIIGYDLDFPGYFARLFPHRPGMEKAFTNPEQNLTYALRNSSLQGAYLILAARALGLDAGPMSGFDNAGIDAEVFAGTNIKSNFICALGHGVDEPMPRLPRLDFDEACKIV